MRLVAVLGVLAGLTASAASAQMRPEPLVPPPDLDERNCLYLAGSLLRRIQSPNETITVSALRRAMRSLHVLCAKAGRLDQYELVRSVAARAPVYEKRRSTAKRRGDR